jgi:hypothetical protein
MATFGFFVRNRRGIAGFLLALLLQSFAWGVGAESSADLLESESAIAVHEQGCTDDGAAAGETVDGHCNEACHFWSQFQTVFAAGSAGMMAVSPVLRPVSSVFVFDNRSNRPFRPPRASLLA